MRWLLLLLLSVICCYTQAQHLSMQHYTVEDGLPSNRIYEIFRDRKGYLWFATDKGVARYNGVRFQVFTSAEGLACNDVFSFCEDLQGRLWFLAYNGALSFYKDGEIHNAATDSFLRKDYKTGHMENSVVQYDSSITFLCAGAGVFVSIKNNNKKIYRLPRFNDNPDILKIAPDRYKITSMYADTSFLTDTFNRIAGTIPARRLWTVWGQGQRYYFNGHTIYTNRDGTPFFRLNANKGLPFKIRRIYRSIDNSLFVATNNGLYLNDSSCFFRGKDIYAITQDTEGNYWISEKKNGVYKISSWQGGAKYYPDQYNYRCVHAFTDDSNLYFSTGDNSIFRFSNGRAERILSPEKYRPPAPLIAEEAHCLLANGRDYYTYFNKDLFCVRNIRSAQRVITYYRGTDPSTHSKSLFYYDSTLFTHNVSEIRKFQFSDGHKVIMHTIFTAPPRIYGADMDSAGNIWYSGSDAVYKYKPEYINQQLQFGLISFKLFRLLGSGFLGITHEDKLLLCADIERQIQIDTIDNHDFVCDKFYQLDRDHVLLNTNGPYRVLRLFPPGHTPRYSLQIIDNPLIPRQAEYVCTNSHTCYFLFMGNIYSIPIRDLLKPSAPPRLFFTTLQAGKHLLNLGNKPATIHLPYTGTDNIDIRFDVLSFHTKDVIYEYSLSKDNREHWLPTRDERIRIPDPGYGQYLVKVRARIPGSAFSAPILLRLYILKPFWATWWFITCCAFLLTVLTVLIIRHRITRVLRKREQLHRDEIKFLRSEYKAQNALMNPHFIFNTLNSVQALINRNESASATSYLKTFSDLVRQNMYNISDELISLQREMNLVEHYIQLEKLRFKELLNYTIDIDDNVDTEDILVPPLLIQPLVENAIRHGLLPVQSTDNHLWVRIYEQGYDLYIEIADNGTGFHHQTHARKAHTSFGLNNIRQRIEQLSMLHQIAISMDIQPRVNDQGQEQGTRVVLIIRESAS